MTDTGHNLVPVDFDPFAPQSQPDTLPLTEPQAEMWTAAAMDEDANRSYNQCFVFTLEGELRTESLRAALAQVVSRHAALRAVLSADGSGQTLRPAFSVEMPVLDMSGLDTEARAREIDSLVERECETSFDLERGPLIRALVVREGERSNRFVLTVHHIVCDGWSSSVLFSDLARCYAADRSGIDAQLPPAPSYAAYVTEQAGASAAAGRKADEDYWAAQFADGAPVLDLPLSRARPEAKTFRGAQETHRIDPQLYAALKGAGAKAGATLFATLLAAFELLVHRLSRQNDFVVGIPLAGQAFLDDSRLVGHCVHTLPLRVRVDPTQPFLAHLRAVRLALADAQEHPHLTFGSLVRRLRIPRDASRTPLVAVTFNIDKIGAPFDFEDVAIASLTVPKAYTNFELAVNVVDSGKDALVECAYNSDLFTGAAIKRWLAHYETLLRSIVANPDAVNSSLSLLTSNERTDVLGRFNPRVASPPGRSLHERFEAVARARPTAVAATCDGDSMTYAELNRRANGLAARLREMGVERNHLVALRTERSLSVAVGILGILKAGGAYLPMDPAYPRDRITFMLEDAGVRVAVTERALADDFAGATVTVALIDEIEAADDIPASGSAPDDLAYVIYTSGSTGKPKGVRVTHHNVARLLEATNDWFHFDADDVWTLFHSYAFDFSVWELWGALLYGGRVVIVPQWVSRAPESFLELLAAEGVTVLNQTPSAFRQLIQADLGSETVTPLKLRYVIFGGEALELQSLRPWFERHGEDRPLLVNMYGITETTVHVTYRPIRLADLESGAGSVIGEPIPDLRVYLLDGDGEPVPQGVPGEIVVGGAGVAAGYLNRPELTAQRFVPDTFAGSGRLYRSGDLARRLESGDLEYLGRIDQQVKIRGFRIEPGEIEAVLGQQPGIREAAVMVREDRPGDKRLVAYVAADESRGGIDELRKLLRAQLPEYMVPASIVVLPRLPLTPNGKIDKAQLPAPDAVHAGGRVPPAPLRTDAERLVGGVWSELLEVETVGPEDNFFDLGGHSLLAINAAQRIHALTGVKLHTRDLIFQTLGQIAASLQTVGVAEPKVVSKPPANAPADGGGFLDRLLRRSRSG